MQFWKIEGMGFDSNIYVLGSGGEAAVIDTGTGFNSSYVIESITEKVDAKSIKAIILTHEHFDHCGGVPDIKERCDEEIVEVMCHEKGAETLEEGRDWSSSLFGVEQPPVRVDRKLADGDIIEIGEMELKVIYTPGHSPGSICLYEAESRSLFSGDTIFSDGGVGRTDFWGGDAGKLANSIRRISEFEVVNLYPGHGPHVIGNGAKHVRMALRTAEYMLGL